MNKLFGIFIVCSVLLIFIVLIKFSTGRLFS
jgi:preprotein translocase subunit SecG